MTDISFEWRGDFTSDEANALHAEAFGTSVFSTDEWDWVALTTRHSLGWVTARGAQGELAGFVNVVWDGLVHAWIQDTMVSLPHRGHDIGTRLVGIAKQHARDAGCEWLHVDFDPELADFYLRSCGFRPAAAGLIALQDDDG